MQIGIDLGSSNSLASILSPDGTPVLVPDVHNGNINFTQSKVLITDNNAYAGDFACKVYERYPQKQLIENFKRSFGTNQIITKLNNEPIFSETIAGILLKKIKYDIEVHSAQTVSSCVITSPAHFNDTQRKSIIDSAKLAGLEVSAILDEPVAAALFYTSQSININDELIMIYDLGGGTFDLTIMTYAQNKLHIVAKDGITKLGGKEFDQIVLQKIQEIYKSNFGEYIPNNHINNNRLSEISEKIKIRLSTENTPVIQESLFINNKFLTLFFSKEEFQKRAEDLIFDTEKSVSRTLKSLGMNFSDISKLVLIGGASNSKIVYDFWNKKIDERKQKIIYHQPLASIAKGAALYSGTLTAANGYDFISSFSLQNVSGYNIALKDSLSGKIEKVIEKNLPLPVKAIKTIKVNPSNSQAIEMILCQYIDSEINVEELGKIKIKTLKHKSSSYFIDITVENKLDGTLGFNVKDPDTKQNIPFTFEKSRFSEKNTFDLQKSLIDSLSINAIP